MRGPQGYQWLPDLARSVGRSMRILRSEVKHDQEGSETDTTAPGAPPSSDDGGP